MMMKERTLCLSCILLLLAGCGEIGGGAMVVPKVTVLPANPDRDAPAGEASSTDVAGSGTAVVDGGFGTVRGKIVVTGSVPSLPLLIAKGADVKDAEVCAAIDVPDERLVVGADSGLANVFVYLQSAPKGGRPLEVSDELVIFDQKNCIFLPHCLIVPVGRTVAVLSADAVTHNTHTYPQRNDGVSNIVPPNDREGQLRFSYRRPEGQPIRVTCDFHNWMWAFHLPLDHPYGTVTDTDGNFELPDLPSGSHSLVVWHESVDGNFIERRLNVTVRGEDVTEVKIEVPISRFSL